MDSDFDETNNEEEGEEDKGVRSIVENGKPFPRETVAVLEALYRKGMVGWGKSHSNDISIATGSTGLNLSQVKVIQILY